MSFAIGKNFSKELGMMPDLQSAGILHGGDGKGEGLLKPSQENKTGIIAEKVLISYREKA